MFEEHRKFKSCFYCTKRGKLTREHLFGKAIVKWFDPLPNWEVSLEHSLSPNRPNSSTSQNTVKGSSSILHIAPKILCSPCNNEIFGEILNVALPTLKSLIHGQKRNLSPKEQYYLFRYFGTLGASIDVLTSNFEATPRYYESRAYQANIRTRQDPPIFSSSNRVDWKNDISFKHLDIRIGYHSGILGGNPHVNIVPLPGYHPGKRCLTTIGKRILIALGKLACCITLGVDHREPASTFHSISKRANDIHLEGDVSYHNFYSMYAYAPNIAHILNELEDPTKRDFIHRESAKEGRLVLP